MAPRPSSFKRFVQSIVAAAATAGVALAATGALTAQQPADDQSVTAQLAPGAGRVQVLIEMREDSAATAFASVIERAPLVTGAVRQMAAQAGLTQAQRVADQQEQVTSSIAAAGIDTTELYRVQKAMNAIAAEVDGADVAALRELPGVKAVHLLELEYPNNSSGVPAIAAPPVWGNTIGLPAGATGTGIRIGIIDTGVDYLHADFGGSGVLSDYQNNNRAFAPDVYFPTAKVAGGYDFAGDNYNGNAATIAADPDPMDCNGHGTHVAGSAAGYGVLADGSTYPGPYGPSTPFSSLRIGPGSAPGAQLYALRVFGCGGGTNLTVQAIDWAMDPNGDLDMSDHLDVINMSLGSALGMLTSTSTIAAENAAAAGVVVVASAGNSGDVYYVNGAPGVSARTISVAATSDGGNGATVLRVNSPAVIAGFKATGIPVAFGVPPPPGGITGNVVQAVDPADGAGPLTTDACSPLTNAAAIAGNIAFIDRGTCGFEVKTKNAQDAGATGVIIASNVSTAIGNMGGVDPDVVISAFLVSQSDGNGIRANLGAPVNVTLFNGADTLASFSSRGPGPNNRVKPDLAAPGYNITSAQTGTTCTNVAPSTGCQTVDASGFIADSAALRLSGTSMAAPHVAGMMALLKQLHPDWSVEQLKALAMNTATHDVTQFPDGGGARYGAGRVGAGRVDASNAAQAGVVAFNAADAGAISVSFATRQVLTTATEVKRVRIVNSGSSAASYDLGIDTVVDAPGVSFSLPGGGSLSIPAHSSVEIDVQMSADAALMDHTREATVASSQASSGTLVGLGVLTRHWITEETGYVTLSQSGNLKLRVPLYAAPRPASAMSAATVIGDGNPTGSSTIALTGDSACTGTDGGPTCTGTLPTDVVSLVTPFQLAVISPRDPSLPANADIQYAGVQFDQTNNRLIFGTAMWGERNSPSDTTVNIYIDTNSDGTWDRILFSGSVGVMNTALFGNTGQDPTDTFVNAALTIATLGVSLPGGINRHTNVDPAAADSQLLGSNVMVQSATLANLAVSGAFRWKVVTCPGTLPLCKQLNGFQYDEEAGPFVFDSTVGNQGLNFNGGAFFFDLPGATLPVTWNTANMAAQGSPGALLLHTHNMTGTRAEVVPMVGATTTDLSITANSAPPAPAKGANVTLTLTTTNTGAAATGILTAVALPAGLTYVSDDGGGAFNPGTGQWSTGSLANGASATLHITATVTTTDEQQASAFVYADAPLDAVPGNNQATVNVQAPRDADLLVTTAASTPSTIAGNPVSYTVTVKNNGDDPAFNVVVGENFTAGTATFGAGTPSAGSYNSTTGVWTLGTLATGVTQTLIFSVTAVSGPTLTTQATVTSSTGDLSSGNNAASASTTISTRSTITSSSIAAAATAGQLTPITVTVTDTQGSGTPFNPAGTIAIGSSVVADTIGAPCVLAPVPLSTNQSSCQVNVQFDTAGLRTLIATFAGNATHLPSSDSAPSTASCSYNVTPDTLSFGVAGGSGSASVATASGCEWTASSDTAFTEVTGGASGTGNGTVSYQVSANPDAIVRSATLTIGGQTFTVNQAAAACTFAPDATSASYAPAGGAGAVTVATLNGCTVNAVSNAPFIHVTNVGATPNVVVDYTVDQNPAPGGSRSGTMTIAGTTFTVTQSACGFSIAPSSFTVAPAGGSRPVTVTTEPSCAWTATSNDSFITVTSGAAGTGTGTAQYSVQANSGPPRTGTLTIAGFTHTVTQNACTFTIAPAGLGFGPQGGSDSVTVVTQSGCGWNAVSNDPFITVTSGASGSGAGIFNYAVAPNPDSSAVRTGTITVAGQTFTVTQGACNTGVAPTSENFTAAGGLGAVNVFAEPGCAWTAASNAPFIQLMGPGAGVGTGPVNYTVAPNPLPGEMRTGTMTVAGQTITIIQAACAYTILPSGKAFGGSGGSDSVAVTSPAGCTWTAASNDPFITVTSGASGSGNGAVAFAVEANLGTPRNGTMTIAGQTYTVTQTECAFAISPLARTFSSAGGSAAITVSGQIGCAWTASSNAPFVSITSGASGNGDGTVLYNVQANGGAQRTGTLTVAGETFTVTQNPIGTLTLNRSHLTYGAVNNGGTLALETGAQPVSVAVNPGEQWTVTADRPWLHIGSGAGTGPGTFTVEVIDAPGFPAVGSLDGTVTVNAPNASTASQTIAVRLNLYTVAGTTPAFGVVDKPTDGQIVNGAVAVTGWAVDDVQVMRVSIYRDPVAGEPPALVFIGDAFFVADARPDVEQYLSDAPISYGAGWGLVVLTNVLPGGGNGPFTLRAYATDAEGHVSPIGVRSFIANNAAATTPFGTIDTPAAGETVSGTIINFGWALTPLAKTIAIDGSTISVFIDGVFVGHPVYNQARPDVASAFPGLNNTDGPVGAFVVDTTALANGLHSIAWLVEDDAGAQAGIGSRFFVVHNVSSQNRRGTAQMTATVATVATDMSPSYSTVLQRDEVGVRRGFDQAGELERMRAKDGAFVVSAAPLERIEIHMPADAGSASAYHLVGGERRELPPAARLDAARGVFAWQPDAAFVGLYEFAFVRDGSEIRIVIDVR